MGSYLWIIVLILLVLECVGIYVANLARKVAENNADILQNREKEYEKEKGKNLATKEDIEEITRKMEDVKSFVSLSNQKKLEALAEQERILVEILNDANAIANAQNKYFIYLYDTSTRRKFDDLVEMVSDRMTHFFHLCNLAKTEVKAESIDTKLNPLSAAITLLGTEINANSTNAANYISDHLKLYDLAMTRAISEQEKAGWLKLSLESKQKIEAMREKPLEYKGSFRKAIDSYCEWLKELYGKEFFMMK